jgi:nitrogen fixation/metabolism regulation signal transduction histidine kinase
MSENLLSGEGYLRTVLDAFPSSVLIVDHDLQIHDANRAARELLLKGGRAFLRRLCGDIIQCVHARESEGGCGTTDFCPDCVLRQTAEAVAAGTKVFRHTSAMKLERGGRVHHLSFLVTGAPFEYENMNLVILTLEDITELVELRRIIPICSHCRKVRDDASFWHSVEDYLRRYTGVQFSHGICPDCVRRHYPGMPEGIIKKKKSSGEDK